MWGYIIHLLFSSRDTCIGDANESKRMNGFTALRRRQAGGGLGHVVASLIQFTVCEQIDIPCFNICLFFDCDHCGNVLNS